jgi:hypothetical protein
MRLIEEALGAPIEFPDKFDFHAGRHFRRALRKHRLEGTWWPEHRRTAAGA